MATQAISAIGCTTACGHLSSASTFSRWTIVATGSAKGLRTSMGSASTRRPRSTFFLRRRMSTLRRSCFSGARWGAQSLWPLRPQIRTRSPPLCSRTHSRAFST
eukprot:Amastigsp_a4508_135.p4 type:complete len:104 gc:universal Amastigsp_a4508_135:653-342(-)